MVEDDGVVERAINRQFVASGAVRHGLVAAACRRHLNVGEAATAGTIQDETSDGGLSCRLLERAGGQSAPITCAHGGTRGACRTCNTADFLVTDQRVCPDSRRAWISR